MTFIFIQRTLNLYFHSPTYLAIRCCCVPAWLCVTMLFYAMHAPCRTHPNAYTHASSDSSTSSVEFCFQTLFENPLQGHNQRTIFVCHFPFDCFRLASSSVIRNRSNVWLIYSSIWLLQMTITLNLCDRKQKWTIETIVGHDRKLTNMV